MITSFLELSTSPTQQRKRQYEFKEFTASVEDDDNKMFDVKIEYEFSRYYGCGPAITVWSFDYETNGTPNISRQDMIECVKDEIRHKENDSVAFEI